MTIASRPTAGTITVQINGDDAGTRARRELPRSTSSTRAARRSARRQRHRHDHGQRRGARCVDRGLHRDRRATATPSTSIVTVKLERQPAGPDVRLPRSPATAPRPAPTTTCRRRGDHLHAGSDRAERFPVVVKGDVLDELAETFLVPDRPPRRTPMSSTDHGWHDHGQRQEVDAVDRRCIRPTSRQRGHVEHDDVHRHARARRARGTVTVGWFTENGTGTAGSDYSAGEAGRSAFAPVRDREGRSRSRCSATTSTRTTRP